MVWLLQINWMAIKTPDVSKHHYVTCICFEGIWMCKKELRSKWLSQFHIAASHGLWLDHCFPYHALLCLGLGWNPLCCLLTLSTCSDVYWRRASTYQCWHVSLIITEHKQWLNRVCVSSHIQEVRFWGIFFCQSFAELFFLFVHVSKSLRVLG